jgi:hypothetical protein
MIDGHYTEDQWRSVVATIPAGLLLDGVREALDPAAVRYHQERDVVLRAEHSASTRDHWAKIEELARDLANAVERIDRWLYPAWGDDHTLDPGDEQKKTIDQLNNLASHARANADDYDRHAKQFFGQQDPARERLYSEVIHVWTHHLGGRLTISPDGPLTRFLGAALAPVLDRDTPKPRSMRDIVDREKTRRAEQRPEAVNLISSSSGAGAY